MPGRHFRVTEAWWEEPPRRKPTVPAPRVEVVPVAPEVALPGARWSQLALPSPTPTLAGAAVAVALPPAAHAPEPAVSETRALPASVPVGPEQVAQAPESSRVLVSLLARLWLLSNASPAGGAVAAPVPPPPPPPIAATELAVVPDTAPAASELDPVPESPVLEAPEGPSGPAMSNGFPRSGLGEFMVEVARASELPVSSAPAEPPERVTVMIELPRQLHCHRYVDDNAVSRDKCRLFPRIEKPLAPVAR